jgi:hypothetical protein
VTFPLFVRRLHLYLGMFLTPWIVVFGLSFVPFNHLSWFPGIGEGAGAPPDQWTTIVDRPYDLEIPEHPDLRVLGARVLADLAIPAGTGYSVGRPNANRLNVNVPSFRHPIRIAYDAAGHHVRAERRAFLWPQLFTGMHTRAGYRLDSPLQTAWAATIDLLAASLILWMASGLYLWWRIPACRRWGWLAIVSGLASFVNGHGIALTRGHPDQSVSCHRAGASLVRWTA